MWGVWSRGSLFMFYEKWPELSVLLFRGVAVASVIRSQLTLLNLLRAKGIKMNY